MSLLLIAVLIGISFWLYYWFVLQRKVPVLEVGISAVANFDAVVPTAFGEEIILELDPDFEKEWEQYKPVLIEEADTVLLLEAEKLVAGVESIAASKEDVYGKLCLLVPGFSLLYKTDYYEPVNKFIYLTVQSECGIELTQSELAALWK
jgi:hypothetical protein